MTAKKNGSDEESATAKEIPQLKQQKRKDAGALDMQEGASEGAGSSKGAFN